MFKSQVYSGYFFVLCENSHKSASVSAADCRGASVFLYYRCNAAACQQKTLRRRLGGGLEGAAISGTK